MQFAVKNTFLELVDLDDQTSPTLGAERRSQSAPPRPVHDASIEEVMTASSLSMMKISSGKAVVRSNASTATEQDTASSISGEDEPLPGSDSECASCTPPMDKGCSEPCDAKSNRITICLRDSLVPRLDSKAAAFTPKPKTLDADVRAVLAAMQIALASYSGVLSTPVLAEGPMGGISTLTVTMPGENRFDQGVLTCAKVALLDAAARSQSVFVLGYNAKPFEDLCIGTGFQAWIARVPDAHQACACWTTYQKGFCPRSATCRWYHPSSSDLMRVIVAVHTTSS